MRCFNSLFGIEQSLFGSAGFPISRVGKPLQVLILQR
jgi:hypothetical protein